HGDEGPHHSTRSLTPQSLKAGLGFAALALLVTSRPGCRDTGKVSGASAGPFWLHHHDPARNRRGLHRWLARYPILWLGNRDGWTVRFTLRRHRHGRRDRAPPAWPNRPTIVARRSRPFPRGAG